jgi:hypothetical protein
VGWVNDDPPHGRDHWSDLERAWPHHVALAASDFPPECGLRRSVTASHRGPDPAIGVVKARDKSKMVCRVFSLRRLHDRQTGPARPPRPRLKGPGAADRTLYAPHSVPIREGFEICQTMLRHGTGLANSPHQPCHQQNSASHKQHEVRNCPEPSPRGPCREGLRRPVLVGACGDDSRTRVVVSHVTYLTWLEGGYQFDRHSLAAIPAPRRFATQRSAGH